MQPVLNVDDIKRVEVALTRVGVSVSELMHRAGYAAAAEVLEPRVARGSGEELGSKRVEVHVGSWPAGERVVPRRTPIIARLRDSRSPTGTLSPRRTGR